MHIHLSSFTPLYVSKYFFVPIFSPLDCLCTSLHLVLIIWHTVVNSLPCLLNQMHSSPVLCSSSLQDLLPNFPITHFLSATHNILITDCNSDSQSAVVMSTTFYPTKIAPTIYDCMFLFFNKVYFNMVLYLYLHLHIRCNDLQPDFKIHV